MIIISNNMLGRMPIPEDVVIRVNLAWYETFKEAADALKGIKHEVYLDFPSGRTKPPTPTIVMHEALELVNRFKPKYFALSNSENPELLETIKEAMPHETELVPKIETVAGVMALEQMGRIGIRTVMLDREDLYRDAGHSNRLLFFLEKELKDTAKVWGIDILKLSGVVFTDGH
jgi:hypothetical protein